MDIDNGNVNTETPDIQLEENNESSSEEDEENQENIVSFSYKIFIILIRQEFCTVEQILLKNLNFSTLQSFCKNIKRK